MRGKSPPRSSCIVVAASRPICSKNVMAASSRHLLASSATPSVNQPQKVGQFKVRIKQRYESGIVQDSFRLGAVLSGHCCSIQYIFSVPA